jgi:hypothetical protein
MKIMTGHISHHGIVIPSVAAFRVSAREGHAVVQSAPSGLRDEEEINLQKYDT